jgi:hypothetical protein
VSAAIEEAHRTTGIASLSSHLRLRFGSADTIEDRDEQSTCSIPVQEVESMDQLPKKVIVR